MRFQKILFWFLKQRCFLYVYHVALVTCLHVKGRQSHFRHIYLPILLFIFVSIFLFFVVVSVPPCDTEIQKRIEIAKNTF